MSIQFLLRVRFLIKMVLRKKRLMKMSGSGTSFFNQKKNSMLYSYIPHCKQTVFFRIFYLMGYYKLCHHPPPPTITQNNPPPLITIQNKPNITHHYLKYMDHHPPPPKIYSPSRTTTQIKAPKYAKTTSKINSYYLSLCITIWKIN